MELTLIEKRIIGILSYFGNLSEYNISMIYQLLYGKNKFGDLPESVLNNRYLIKDTDNTNLNNGKKVSHYCIPIGYAKTKFKLLNIIKVALTNLKLKKVLIVNTDEYEFFKQVYVCIVGDDIDYGWCFDFNNASALKYSNSQVYSVDYNFLFDFKSHLNENQIKWIKLILAYASQNGIMIGRKLKEGTTARKPQLSDITENLDFGEIVYRLVGQELNNKYICYLKFGLDKESEISAFSKKFKDYKDTFSSRENYPVYRYICAEQHLKSLNPDLGKFDKLLLFNLFADIYYIELNDLLLLFELYSDDKLEPKGTNLYKAIYFCLKEYI